MPAPIPIKLTDEEDQTLQALSAADGVPRRTKQRATALRLNATGWRVPPIAQYLNCIRGLLYQNVRQDDAARSQQNLEGIRIPPLGKHHEGNTCRDQRIHLDLRRQKVNF